MSTYSSCTHTRTHTQTPAHCVRTRWRYARRNRTGTCTALMCAGPDDRPTGHSITEAEYRAERWTQGGYTPPHAQHVIIGVRSQRKQPPRASRWDTVRTERRRRPNDRQRRWPNVDVGRCDRRGKTIISIWPPRVSLGISCTMGLHEILCIKSQTRLAVHSAIPHSRLPINRSAQRVRSTNPAVCSYIIMLTDDDNDDDGYV